jgi:hypothetical protein
MGPPFSPLPPATPTRSRIRRDQSLSHPPAVHDHVAASTQRQALSALLFLYRKVLKLDPPWIDNIVHARQPKRLPTVLSREEAAALLSRLEGTVQLIVLLLYGTGMRILECLRLRIQDVDFDLGTITIRNGKGHKDVKTTMIYTHVLNRSGGRGVVSPADALGVLGGAYSPAIEHPSCDIAEQAIEHPAGIGVQSTYEPIGQRQRRSSMPANETTESSNTPSTSRSQST